MYSSTGTRGCIPLRLIVTGGAGFIGSNFIRYVTREYDDVCIVNLDKLTYAGNLENLADLEGNTRYWFHRCDIAERTRVRSAFEWFRRQFGGPPEAVVHMAAESHVDRSIEDPEAFVRTNVLGTQVLLDVAREVGVERFIQVSTDEVYGSLGPSGAFTEETPLAPNSPYSASKAAADLLARSYYKTFGMPTIVTRCSNNYGPYQFPEKLIPLMICNALEDKPLPLYGDGQNVRDWIHVEDHCAAIDAVLRHGRPGEVYNIGGCSERTNLEVVRQILRMLGKPESLIEFVTDRPGHDRRYAMDISKIREDLGWQPRHSFEEGLQKTIEWYLSHQDWVKRVRSGAYREYYERVYGKREDWLRLSCNPRRAQEA